MTNNISIITERNRPTPNMANILKECFLFMHEITTELGTVERQLAPTRVVPFTNPRGLVVANISRCTATS